MSTAAPTSQFTGVDFLNFDSLLSEEERAVRDTVRTWVEENLIPVIGHATWHAYRDLVDTSSVPLRY